MVSRTVIAAALVAAHTSTECSQCSKEEGESRGLDAAATAIPSRTASCDRVPAASLCSEYSGGYLARNEAVFRSGCEKLRGAFAAAKCPNTAVLGSCELSTTEVRVFYASGAAPYDAAKAQKECVASYGGTWSPIQ